ncbi:hypothetical protein LWF15_27485 [Kineosporia rhizophila]|uniref:hypothetical protein n=1 Tax=Kineosporia rhizophila TaxID=84633 RepID=UPI001E3D5029|nr:hypothetical protein [Kineosporia rhizophila]MCE0539247.1 hypothetical protein [Kineosporia rhizophila]
MLNLRIAHLVAQSMCLQTQGRLIEADRALGKAHDLAVGGPGRLHLLKLPGPPKAVALGRNVWWLLEREQKDLEFLRRLVVDAEKGRGEIVLACIEFYTWVEFDPFLLGKHGPEQTQHFNRPALMNKHDLCDRATMLRQFGQSRRGDVASKTWDRMGGEWSVRARALRKLAGESLARSLPKDGRPPVRLGRLCAYQYAQQVQADVLTTDTT